MTLRCFSFLLVIEFVRYFVSIYCSYDFFLWTCTLIIWNAWYSCHNLVLHLIVLFLFSIVRYVTTLCWLNASVIRVLYNTYCKRPMKLTFTTFAYSPCFRVTDSLAYFALTLTSTSLAGDRFLNFFLSSVVEYPTVIVEYFGLSRWQFC